ncbi:HAD-IB family phosphatase [bacterium]|nr:HAD-IB family phosphatase [bacterium]
MSQLHPILLFDIDGTLINKSLEQWFIRYLWRERKIRIPALIRHVLRHICIWPPEPWHAWKLVYLQGFEERQLRNWAWECWARDVVPALIPESVMLLEALRDQGCEPVLVSGTPQFLAEPLMHDLKIPEIICAQPAVENGLLTGSLTGPHPRGREKVRAVDRWLAGRQLSWRTTIAAADHWEDRHLLLRTRVSLVIRPKQRLRRLAARRQWLQPGPDSSMAATAGLVMKILQSGADDA